jgi:hypothetical protein
LLVRLLLLAAVIGRGDARQAHGAVVQASGQQPIHAASPNTTHPVVQLRQGLRRGLVERTHDVNPHGELLRELYNVSGTA